MPVNETSARQLIARYERYGFDPLRIESATEQLRLVSYSGCREVLEVGCAGGTLKSWSKAFPQLRWATLDLAEELHPDYVGSVTHMPVPDGSFDMVICCQVLEHLPFDQFGKALSEMRRVTRDKAILSLPDRSRMMFRLAVRLPHRDWLSVECNMPRWRDWRTGFRRTGQHLWEMGCKGTRTSDVMAAIERAGFAVETHYRLQKYAWHHFFLLTKAHDNPPA